MLSAYSTGDSPTPPQLVAAEDVREAPGALPDELHLLGALGEVDGEPAANLPCPAGRQAGGLRIHGVQGVDAHLRVHASWQPHAQVANLLQDRLHPLDGFGPRKVVGEELRVDGSGHPALGQLRQALPIR